MIGHGHRTTPAVVVALGAVLAAVLAACGTNGGHTPTPGDDALAPAVIATSSVSGLGTVLVDSSGKTLYFNDQDSGTSLHCADACLRFWVPATASGTTVPPGSVAGLSVIRRSDDGKDQFEYQGRPLYEFRMDAMAGQVNGDDAHDEFAGTPFAWHAAVVAGTGAAASAGATNTGSIPGY
jgi:predicted lipoprotein with Yx(FWY)xxD motif